MVKGIIVKISIFLATLKFFRVLKAIYRIAKMKYIIPLFFLSQVLFLACNTKEIKPNFLIVFTDDQRLNTLGCYDQNCPIKTPNLDDLANSGIKFTNGFVTTPICTVSRACLLTGQYVTNNRMHQFVTPMETDIYQHIYPQYLKQEGYFVGQLGKYGIGITKEQERIYDVYDATDDQGPAFREYKGKRMHDTEWLTVKAKEFFDSIPKEKPFCLQLNYKEPHPSSKPALEDDGLLDSYNFSRQALDTDKAAKNLPDFVRGGLGGNSYTKSNYNNDEVMNRSNRQYFEKIVSVDRSVGKIRTMLKERGLADNTVIIFLSDHGTHLGERHLLGKWTPYDESLRVPFIVFDPRKNAKKGEVLDDMVLNIDVAPTLLEMAGIGIPDRMDGRSLKGLIYGKNETWRDYFFFEHYTSPFMVPNYIPRSVGVRFKDSKYVRWIEVETDPNKNIEEYYDLSKDPIEAINLTNNEDYKQKVQNARDVYNRWREENPSSFKFDEFGPRAQFGSRNIDWERFKIEKPEAYKKIEKEIQRLGIDWDTAVYNWKYRYEISKSIPYWY